MKKLWINVKSRGDFQANSLASLKMKNGMSRTPLNCARNALILALKLSAEALVERCPK